MRSTLDLDATLADSVSPGSEWVEIDGAQEARDELPERLPVLARARRLAGAHALRRRAQPRAAGAPVRAAGQRAGARRADQRPRHRHARAARGAAAGLRRHRVPGQPRPALPRQRRHQHDRLGGRRRAGALARVRGRLRGLEDAARARRGAARRGGACRAAPARKAPRGGRAAGRGGRARQPAAPAAPAVPAKRKLSYKEQRELDALPDRIEALEAEQKDARGAARRAPSSTPRTRSRAEAAQRRTRRSTPSCSRRSSAGRRSARAEAARWACSCWRRWCVAGPALALAACWAPRGARPGRGAFITAPTTSRWRCCACADVDAGRLRHRPRLRRRPHRHHRRRGASAPAAWAWRSSRTWCAEPATTRARRRRGPRRVPRAGPVQDRPVAGHRSITLYLLPEVNLQLRPSLLALKPGTRLVSHDWDMGDWRPDRTTELDVPDKQVGREKKSRVHLWHRSPARVAGSWCGAGAAARRRAWYARAAAPVRFGNAAPDRRERAGSRTSRRNAAARGARRGALALRLRRRRARRRCTGPAGRLNARRPPSTRARAATSAARSAASCGWRS